MSTDVLITGAGPVGLTMAIELARFGLSVRIIDKNAERTDKSKALVIWSRSLELLDRSGAGAKLLAAGSTTTAANLMSGSNTLAHITFDGVDSPHPYALMIPQSETERVLEEHLASLGVKVERSTELTSFTQSDSSVTSALLSASGSTETLETSWLIACDGAHSTIRHQLNLPFEGDTLPSQWMLADVHLHGLSNPGEMHICLHEAGIVAIFPIGPAEQGRARVIANTGNAQSGQPQPDPTLADTQTILDRRGPGGVTASDPVWLANFSINERKIPNFRAGRIFLAGDAAHIHSPAGGQGMNTGMQDACNLAWKLALVHRKLCAATDLLLDSYSAERSPVAEKVLSETGRLTSLATLHNPALLAMRNTAVKLALGIPAAKQAMAKELTELAVHYAKSPLNGDATAIRDTPEPGYRVPLQAGDAPIGAGDTPRFALYAAPGPDAEQFIACFPDLLEPTPRPAITPGTITLVRPDGYVAFTGDTNAYPHADAYMVKLIYGPKQKVTIPS